MDNDLLKKLILNGGQVPQTTYNIDVSKPLIIDTGCDADLTGSKIVALPTGNIEKYALLHLNGSNITLRGGEFVGARNSQKTTTAWGFGIRVGGSGVSLFGQLVRDCGGDGLYLYNCHDVLIKGVQSRNNRRQGLSIISGSKITVQSCIFADTNGARPGDGIDIEPDKGDAVSDVIITGNTFRNNEGCHIEVAGKRGSVHGVTITDNIFDGKRPPLKIAGVDNAAKYKPSLLLQLYGQFGIYTNWPKQAVIQ